MSRNRQKKLDLFKKNPYCCYCGCLTRLIVQKPHEVAQNYMATLEHITDRYEEKRYTNPEYAIACYKCNHKRGTERNREKTCEMDGTFVRWGNLLRVALLNKDKRKAKEIVDEFNNYIEQNL